MVAITRPRVVALIPSTLALKAPAESFASGPADSVSPSKVASTFAFTLAVGGTKASHSAPSIFLTRRPLSSSPQMVKVCLLPGVRANSAGTIWICATGPTSSAANSSPGSSAAAPFAPKQCRPFLVIRKHFPPHRAGVPRHGV